MNVHILFGQSTAGGLKWAIRENRENIKSVHNIKIIGSPDHFAGGPIFHLDTDSGIANRTKWFKDHMPKNEFHDYYEKEYEERFRETIQEIEAIPEDALITIWHAENAAEKTGLSFVLKLLADRKNEILIINSNESYNKFCKHPDIYYVSLHTGELSQENLLTILEKTKGNKTLSTELYKQLVDEWNELRSSKDVLRVWENSQIKSVEAEYLDSFMIELAIELHEKPVNQHFMKAARLVGEVLGRYEQYIGDAFIEYDCCT
ncbi:DUF1835 domain-containing protein [Fictibacillus arsenicus]|uniref:DUF1835 domain-containing protein n=1 Tax=Fictibacillus arsenicus TaxID=255247 RepID=A0A1V3G8X0_9BACL|nr:DUF1835 domain-containing protein [Fictibacillus arsenicus]OOE12426.1 hypothetical protein UN64_10015 [Fictibacillus arsenicus]